LKHRFTDLAEDAFCSRLKAQNYFEWSVDHLKYRFLDFAQVDFVQARRQKTGLKGC
jgi:hypothetical protein